MRRVIACTVLAAALLGVSVPQAHAGGRVHIAIGLGAFPVFAPVPFHHHRFFHPAFVVAPPRFVVGAPFPVVYSPPPVYAPAYAPVYAPPPAVAVAPQPTVVDYPHGRYELRQQYGQYVWVWVPKSPLPPPPPPPPQ